MMISPLLDLAGLYDSRFTIRTEASVEIVLEAEGEILQGRMDTLILADQIWILVVEAKNSTFALSVALPQLLTYMLSAPSTDGTARFGLATNGEEFRFVKLQAEGDRALFDLSAVLSVMQPSRNQLAQVVQVLRSLASTDWLTRDSRAKYDAVLAKVPDIEPEEYDRLPETGETH
ncbi:MAG: hypothetical protein HC860_22875 [Alkalinema sp. RU_4_3]|nr:hypothetical protein [Alkalinema sp. RU_4_3]